jgi:pyruvate,water dikinase
MELMAKHPYEDETYVDRLIEEHRNDNLDMYQLQATQKKAYEEALAEFKQKYPSKKNWIDKKIARFVQANTFREDLRSKGVWIFCVFREYILRAGQLTGLNDDVFMLLFDELFDYLRGDASIADCVKKRRETYEKYLTYPTFPNIILGRFDADAWMADANRRNDAYVQDMALEKDPSADIKGFAGAAGIIQGKVRVIADIEHIGDVQDGDILVTSATNIGWTPVFTKVSAIVTDIGAPLSHAAIVARECGIPAVVGCGNATTLLHTGDEVIVNGSAGTVTLVKP